MADIELVIKIPEEAKQAFDCAESNDLKGSYYDFGGIIGNAIKNGIPLPEHHSDLIERSSLDVDNLDRAYGPNLELDFGRLYTQDVIEMIEKAPTIVPATKGEN